MLTLVNACHQTWILYASGPRVERALCLLITDERDTEMTLKIPSRPARLRLLVLPALLLSFVLTIACQSDAPTAVQDDTARTVSKATEPAGEYTGEILIDGSSTVYPITSAAAEDFRIEYPSVQIPVGISGTGGGFKKFTAGETVIADASRPIKDSERELAAANGIEFIELAVAFDGLSVMVNPDNDFASCLTTDELKMIWEPESSVSTWRDVRGEWPNEEIVLYGPDADSGTFDYFTEEIVGDTGLIRQDFYPAVDDNVLVQGIAGDLYSLGYFGYAYYAANTDKLKLVSVDSGGGCVTPTETTINDGSYTPLSRPLFIYVNIAELARPEVEAFVNYFLENGPQLAASVDYVGLPQAMYEDALELVANPIPDVE